MLKLNNIYKSFGDREILSGLNLELEKGKIYSLMGANGAGKTILLIEHNTDFINTVSDKIFFLSDGTITEFESY